MKDRLRRGEELIEIELTGSELTIRQGGDELTEPVFSIAAARKRYVQRVEEMLADGFELCAKEAAAAEEAIAEPLAGWSISLSDYDHERERHYHLRLSFDTLTIEIERHLVINPDYLAAGADVPPERVLESRYGFCSTDAFDRFLSALLDELYDRCFEAYGDDGNTLSREMLGEQIAALARRPASSTSEPVLEESDFSEEIALLLEL